MLHFSVLISIYHKEKPNYLSESLDSILNQSLLPSEIVLVKDGPIPESLNLVIEEFQRKLPLKVVTLSTNQGLGKALSEGLKQCSYELVARMDSDDIAKSNRFEKQVEVFSNNSDIDIVSAWVDEFEGSIGNIVATRKLPEFHEDILIFAKSRCPINHPVAMFKKSAVSAAGGYKPFPLFEDYYLWVRMLLNNSKFYNLQDSLLYFRASPEMYKRRGGWKYANDELRFQNKLRKLKFISFSRYIKNIVPRLFVRLAPNNVRSLFYKKFLRN